MEMFNLTPWRFILIDDYKPNESLFLGIGHHCFVDGVQYFSILQGLTLEKDFSQFPRISTPTFL